MSQMLRLRDVGRRRIRDGLFWIAVFSLRLFLSTSAVTTEVNRVIINDDQHTFHCSSSTGGGVWYYRATENEDFVNTVALQDTSYIVSPPNLHITQIEPKHEGFYSCDTDSMVFQLIVLAMPRFIGCFDDSPCEGEDQQLSEGDNIRFNISVGYIPGGPLGEQQNLRLVSLLKGTTIQLNCLQTDLGTCVRNPLLSEVDRNRIHFERDADNPWFDIDINITNAVPADMGLYYVELEADDVNAPGTVTQSTSTITVSVSPTLASFPMSSSVYSISSSDSSTPSASTSQGTELLPSSVASTSLSSTQTTSSRSSTSDGDDSSSMSVSPVTGDSSNAPEGIGEAILVVIVLGSSFLILAGLGVAVLIVMFLKKKDKEERSSKVVELKSSTTQQVFFNDNHTTVTTYTEDNTFSSYSCYVGKSPSSGDDVSLPRCSIILVDDHRNSDAVRV